jgi:phosphoribosyl-ATP pyrophosphohydrolase
MSRSDPLYQLMSVIDGRRHRPSAGSYTSQLLQGGVERIAPKITEEAAELVEAARENGDEGRSHMIREAADLTYHMLVLLASRQAGLADLEGELARRFGTSGLEEKRSRG